MSRDRLSLLLLRIGLGITFLWIGIDMIRHPDVWIGYIPPDLLGQSQETTLKLAALFDSVLGILLLLGFFRKTVAVLVSLHLLGIIIVHKIDAVIIRDVGLLGASLALLLWPSDKRQRYRSKKPWYRKLI